MDSVGLLLQALQPQLLLSSPFSGELGTLAWETLVGSHSEAVTTTTQKGQRLRSMEESLGQAIYLTTGPHTWRAAHKWF